MKNVFLGNLTLDSRESGSYALHYCSILRLDSKFETNLLLSSKKSMMGRVILGNNELVKSSTERQHISLKKTRIGLRDSKHSFKIPKYYY